MRGTDWLLAGIVMVLALTPFAGVSDHELVLDARFIVGGNELVLENDWSGILRSSWWARAGEDSPGFVNALYRPVTVAWLALFYDGQGDAGSVAQANAALHGLGAALRFLLIALIFAGRPWARPLAFGAALFPAVHALSAQGVVGQVGAAETLAHVFCVASWLLFALGLARRGGLRFGFFVGAALLWGLGALAKESALVFPVVLFLHALIFSDGGRDAEDDAREGARLAPVAALLALLPFVAVLGGVCAARIAVLGEVAPFDDTGVYRGFAVGDRIASALAVQGHYALRFFWPFEMAPIITHDVVRPPASFFSPGVLFGALVWGLGIAGVLFSLRRRCPAALFGIAAGLTMLPASNLIVGIGAVGGYRFVYAPIAFVAVALGAAIAFVHERRPAAAKALCVVAAVFTVLGFVGTRGEVRTWANPDALTERAYEISPQDPHALSNYAVRFHLEKLRGNDAKAVDRAIDFHTRFAEIEPELARIPGRDWLPEQTRILATRILSNHAQVLTLRSAMTRDNAQAQDRDAERALELLGRAEAYAVGRPVDRLTCRLRAAEVRLGALAEMSRGRRLDPTTRELAVEELRTAFGETKLYMQAHRDQLPDRQRINYEFESARFASIEENANLVVARLGRVFAIDPYDERARGFEADLLIRRGRLRLALQRLEEMIDARRVSVSVYARAADLAGRLKDGAKQMRYLQGVVSVPPRSTEDLRMQQMAAQQLQAAGVGPRPR